MKFPHGAVCTYRGDFFLYESHILILHNNMVML